MKPALAQYEVQPEPFWDGLLVTGGDGYDAMEQAEKRRWQAIASWGRDGWDLGSWPITIVFFRKKEDIFQIASYCEGDITQYDCPTKEIRNAITDEIAFFYWKHQEETWVSQYKSVDQLPPELRNPYSRNRSE